MLAAKMSEPAVKFAADRMLGRLAKWLRLLGFDTLYGPQLAGPALARAARPEGRVVLTRDQRMRRHAEGLVLLFIEGDHFREQLRQVLTIYRLDPWAQLLTRCSRCNLPIEPVAKERVAGRVPPYVWETQAAFSRCPSCRRIYWPATHDQRIRDELARLGMAQADQSRAATSRVT
jgi:uncharacterized protein with PIN domain